MVVLLDVVSNNGKLRYMGGLNGLIGRGGDGNDNGYIGTSHKKLSFSCHFLLFLFSEKAPSVYMNTKLEIALFLFSNSRPII